jgi:hypothetical protein
MPTHAAAALAPAAVASVPGAAARADEIRPRLHALACPTRCCQASAGPALAQGKRHCAHRSPPSLPRPPAAACAHRRVTPRQGDIWGLSTVVLSFLDWPLRRAFPGVAALSQARPCKPGTHAYDEKVAAEIWDVSAEFAGLPKAPQV